MLNGVSRFLDCLSISHNSELLQKDYILRRIRFSSYIFVYPPPLLPCDLAGATTAVLHYDDYENLLCQIRGTKEVVLFPPKDLENLYYVGRRKGKLEYQYPGKWRR